MALKSLQYFCDENGLQITSFYKTILNMGNIKHTPPDNLGDMVFSVEFLEEALKVSQGISEPFYCDYLHLDGSKERIMIQPQRVWYGLLPETQEQHWLLTALNVSTDTEIILRLSHINA